jgi:hypothetical protein
MHNVTQVTNQYSSDLYNWFEIHVFSYSLRPKALSCRDVSTR